MVIKALRQRLDKIERENQILRSERDSPRATVHNLDRLLTAQRSAVSDGPTWGTQLRQQPVVSHFQWK